MSLARNAAMAGVSMVAAALLLAACGGDDDDASAGPVRNLTTSTQSVCSAPGAAPGDFSASCADDQPLATVDSDKADAYCADKRFGTFFFVNESGQRHLLYCESPTKSSWFAFGDEYESAIVTLSNGKAQPFGVGPGYSFRCAQDQEINNHDSLPLNQELCDGFSVIENGDTPKVSKDGYPLALVHIGGSLR